MLRHTKSVVCLRFGIALLILLPALTQACGGFFCTTTPIDQNAERIIFAVNEDDGTITAIVGIGYTGAAEDFSWVVPVPSPPTLDVAETASLDMLDAATSMQINAPPHHCAELYPAPCCFGGGGGPILGQVGPYDYAIIGSDDPDEMVRWLRENGYRITLEMEPLIAVYVEEGMYFLAMKLSQESTVGDIKPVVMTYESDNPMIPIRLTAVAAIEDMPIITWIFADTQYVPGNYAHSSVDFKAFPAPNQLVNMNEDRFGSFFFRPISTYTTEQKRIQDEFDGLVFITEFAQPSASLPPAAQDDPLIAQLIERYPYVTRLRAQMSPNQMTLDPTFIRVEGAPDVSNQVDLGVLVNPFEYWGCSSRYAITNEGWVNMPAGRTRIPDLYLELAHPEGWRLSEFTLNNAPAWALSPMPVDDTTLTSFFAGESSGPILVFTQAIISPLERGRFGATQDDPAVRSFLSRLGQRQDTTIPTSEGYIPIDVRYWPAQQAWNSSEAPDGAPFRGLVFGLLASEENWLNNGATYQAMLEYATSFQYYVTSDLRHTLFLTDRYYNHIYGNSFVTEVAYPDGWTEQIIENDIIITPEDATDTDSVPLMRLTPIRRYDSERLPDWAFEYTEEGGLATPVPTERNDLFRSLVERLNLTGDVDVAAITEELATTYEPIPSIFPFERAGRQGYVRFTHAYIVEVAAPEADFQQHEDILLTMVESLISRTNW